MQKIWNEKILNVHNFYLENKFFFYFVNKQLIVNKCAPYRSTGCRAGNSGRPTSIQHRWQRQCDLHFTKQLAGCQTLVVHQWRKGRSNTPAILSRRRKFTNGLTNVKTWFNVQSTYCTTIKYFLALASCTTKTTTSNSWLKIQFPFCWSVFW